MAMETREEIIDSMKGMVARELNELAWMNKYPVNPAFGLNAFLNAFRDYGYQVIFDDNEATFISEIFYGGKRRFLCQRMGYEDILNGWKNGARGSPSSLYDSIYTMYDNARIDFQNDNEDIDNRDFWERRRWIEPREIREKMETHLEDMFHRYHEHALVAVDGTVPEIGPPQLFDKIISKFPMRHLEAAIDYQNNWEYYKQMEYQRHDDHRVEVLLNAIRGPSEEGLLEFPERTWDDEFSINYFPSESTLLGYFMGKYYEGLRQQKGYHHSGYGRIPLHDLVVVGRDALATWDQTKRNLEKTTTNA